jgi:hypothetical protein
MVGNRLENGDTAKVVTVFDSLVLRHPLIAEMD